MNKIKRSLEEFENKIKYKFNNINLLKQALVHSSYANEKKLNKLGDNERLEYLGDAVLELVTSHFLYKEYPNLTEGELTKYRASIVCEATLSSCAKRINLGQYILLGKGEELSGGRERNSVLSDALEAVIGSIYLDEGLEEAEEFVKRFILSNIQNIKLFYDSKTMLQELVQQNSQIPVEYMLLDEKGPDHNKLFIVAVRFKEQILGTGKGRSKKIAEQEAAYNAIKTIKNDKSVFG